MKKVTRSRMIFPARLILAHVAFVSTLALSDPPADRSSPPIAVSRAAKETLVIEGSTLHLKASIWRDLIPIGVPDDPNEARAIVADARGLRAVIALTDVNGMPVPPTLHAELVWIVQGARVWKTDEIEEQRDDASPSIRNFVVHKGPQWPIKSFVDVFVRISDQHGAHFVLVLRHQIIAMSV
jgi:hypothetical protein